MSIETCNETFFFCSVQLLDEPEIIIEEIKEAVKYSHHCLG